LASDEGVVGEEREFMNVVSLNLQSNAWKLISTGAWQGRCDRKGVYVMSHPYEPAHQGASCHIRQTAALPDSLPEGGSVWFRFYSSDGYIGSDRSNPEVGYAGSFSFPV
jgi:hypothetical protein